MRCSLVSRCWSCTGSGSLFPCLSGPCTTRPPQPRSTVSSGWAGSCWWPARFCSVISSCSGSAKFFARLFGKQLSKAKFRTPLLYRHVRHPIYLGVLLAVWATPAMTVGHLLFSVVITGYILIGIQLEEHDLIQQFGDQYRLYRQHAAMLVPLPGRKFTSPKVADV